MCFGSLYNTVIEQVCKLTISNIVKYLSKKKVSKMENKHSKKKTYLRKIHFLKRYHKDNKWIIEMTESSVE